MYRYACVAICALGDVLEQRSECANMPACTFFQMYSNDERYRGAVSGFILMYCRGERQDRCVRKEVSRKIGGPQGVPANMLPNGLPVSGTDGTCWSREVIEALGRKA